jgi:DHA1 family bicyclomycin/chloramphenicol resistance-like MFS transporter
MTQNRLTTRTPPTLILILLAGFAAFSTVIIGPSLPAITHAFQINAGHAQSLVTIFLLGYACGQLIYGPLANRFGRIQAFYFGLSLAIVAAALCIGAQLLHNFLLLEIGRFLGAVGACCGLVVSYTIVSDFYHTQQARAIYSYLTIAFALSPAVATALGGMLQQYFNWSGAFYLLFFYGIFLLYLASRLPETSSDRDYHALQPSKILYNYLQVFKNRFLVLNALIYGMSTMCAYVYVTEAPFIMIKHLGLSPASYGWLAMLPFLGVLAGALSGPKIAHYFSSQQIIKYGLFIEFMVALLLLALFACNIITLLSFLMPMVIFMYVHSLVLSNCSTMALQNIKDRSNSSAVFSFLFMMPPVIGNFALDLFPVNKPIYLPLIFLIALLLYAVSYYQGYVRNAASTNSN